MKISIKNLAKSLPVIITSSFYLPNASAAILYNVADLGQLGGTYGNGMSVNNQGNAVGFSHLTDNLAEHAILGDGSNAPVDIGTLGGNYSQAYSINNLGAIAGASSSALNARYQAFRRQNDSIQLNALAGITPSSNSRAFSINDGGQIAGYSSTISGSDHAVRWSATGGVVDLGVLSGTGNSYGMSINSAGQVAGYSNLTGFKTPHAVLWTSATNRQDLGTLGGNYSVAFGINDSNQITGSSSTAAEAQHHAFIWQSGITPPMQDIGTLGGTFSEGYDISENGEVVGYSTTINDNAQRAFIWKNSTGLQDLNSLIDPTSGWTLLEAHGISDDGKYITGIGNFNGERHAFLLTGIPLDVTAPNVSYVIQPAAPSITGWYITSPSLTWNVNDPESLVSNSTGCVNIPRIADTVGRSFSCFATSAGGTSETVVTPTFKVDTIAPTLTNIPLAFTQQATNTLGAIVNYTAPIASDAHSGVKAPGVSCSPASGSSFPMGDSTVTCSVGDNAGNTANASFVATVADLTPPVITPTINGLAGLAGWYRGAVTVSWSVVDNESALTAPVCATVSALNNTANQVFNCTGSSEGGPATGNTNPFGVDSALPSFVGFPANITVNATSAAGAVVNFTLPTATDTLSGVAPSGVSCATAIGLTSGSTFPVGINTVVCTVSDRAGNIRNRNLSITVNPFDTTPPVITPTITGTLGQNGWYTGPVSIAWSATDAQSTITSPACAAGNAVLNAANQSFSCTAESAGGSATETRVLNVDSTAPTLTGVPAAFTVAASSSAGVTATYGLPVASDALSGVGASGVSCLPASGSTFAIGDTTVTCSASDNAGNTATASFVVTVADQSPPVITPTITGTLGQNGWYVGPVSISWTATDAQSAITSPACATVNAVLNAANQSFSCSAQSGGGLATETRVLNVDSTAPTLTGVPAAFTVAASSSAGATATYGLPVASDALSGVGVSGVSCLPASGSTFAIGNTTVTCSASDNAGNARSASFVVTVADQTPPAFSSCPATVTLTQGQTLPQLVATDNASTPVVTRNPAGTLGLGTTAVTWTATDGAGLTATCLQQVTVNPVITETINITRSQCKRRSATSGEWLVQGTSSIRTGNTIQLYLTGTVPANLTTNRLGNALTVSTQGAWQYSARSVACTTPISLISSATSTKKENISVTQN